MQFSLKHIQMVMIRFVEESMTIWMCVELSDWLNGYGATALYKMCLDVQIVLAISSQNYL